MSSPPLGVQVAPDLADAWVSMRCDPRGHGGRPDWSGSYRTPASLRGLAEASRSLGLEGKGQSPLPQGLEFPWKPVTSPADGACELGRQVGWAPPSGHNLGRRTRAAEREDGSTGQR